MLSMLRFTPLLSLLTLMLSKVHPAAIPAPIGMTLLPSQVMTKMNDIKE
ncbi:hypothetical protein Tco_0975400, partial [Tanacetum coccineum]